MNLDQDFLNILACPACKASVIQRNDKIICENPQCGLSFPIREGIPVMLIEEAQKKTTAVQ